MAKNKILMVGTQGQVVSSGPGTFMRYLSEAIKSGALCAEILYPHSKQGTPYGEESFVHCSNFAGMFYLRFPGSWVLTAFYVWLKLKFGCGSKQFSAFWFADRFSALFCSLDPELRKRSIVMVNDDTRIFAYKESRSQGFLAQLHPRSLSRRLFYVSERFICRRCCGVVSNSSYLSLLLEEEYGLVGKVKRLYKAVDLSKFKAVESGGRQNDVSPKSVLFLKNEWRRGGLDILIEALAIGGLANLHLKIAGMDLKTDRTKIESLIREKCYKGEVEFIGRVEREQIPALMASSDMFCVPSRIEALGVAFLEALATGITVIGTDTGGIPEVLAQGQAGWLVPVEDPVALSHALNEVVNNKDLVESKRTYGLKHALEFSTEKMIEEIKILSKYFYGEAK